MYGLKKSPIRGILKHNSSDPKLPVNTNTNPFDSDDESDNKQPSIKSSGRTSSEPSLLTSDVSTNPFDDDEVKFTSQSKSNLYSSAKNRYKNDFHNAGGLENQSLQELENYAVYKAEETTKNVNHCLKLAEDIREDATKTLVTLHQQGEQITRTHMVAADMDHDLSRMSGGISGSSNPSLDTDYLLEIRERFKLTKEKEMLIDSKSQGFELIRVVPKLLVTSA